LRNHFPGRTALVDFETVRGQMKVFDTILGSPGRDYVIDLTADQTQRFREAAIELGFFPEARRAGYCVVVLFVVDLAPNRSPPPSAWTRRRVPISWCVMSAFVGTSLPESYQGLTIAMSELDPATLARSMASAFRSVSFCWAMRPLCRQLTAQPSRASFMN